MKVHPRGRRSKSMAVASTESSSPPLSSSKPPPLSKRMSLLNIGRRSSMSSLVSSNSFIEDSSRMAVYRFLDLCNTHDQDPTHNSQVILELMKEAKQRGDDPMLAQYRDWLFSRGDRYFCKLCMNHKNDVPRNVILAHQGYELKDKQPFYAILKTHTKNKQHQEYLEKMKAKNPKPTSASIADLASMKYSKALVGVKAHLSEYPWLHLDHNMWMCKLCKKLDDKALAALSKRDFYFAVKGFDSNLKEELPEDILAGEDWQANTGDAQNSDEDELDGDEIYDDLFEDTFEVPDLDQEHSCLSVVCNVQEADGVFTKSEIERGVMSCVKVRYADQERITCLSGGTAMPKYGDEQLCFLSPCDKVVLEATIWKESLDNVGKGPPSCDVLVGGVALPVCRLEPNKWTEQWYQIHGKTHLKMSIYVSVKSAAVPGLGYFLRVEDVDSRIDKLKIPPKDIIDATRELGLDGPYFNHLLWISKTYLTCDLPNPWQRLHDSKGSIYYFNPLTMDSSKQNPLFPYFYELAQRKKSQTEFRGFKISGEPYNYDSKYDIKIISNRTNAHRKTVNERQANEALVQKTLYRQAAAIRALPKYYIDKDEISRKKRRDEDISSGRISLPRPKETNPESPLRQMNVDPLLNDPDDDPLEELREEKEYKEMYEAEDLRSHRKFVRVARKRLDVSAPPKGFLASKHISKSCRKNIELQLKIDYNKRMAKAFYDCYQEMTQPVDMDFTLDYDWPSMHSNPHAYSASGPMPVKDGGKSMLTEDGEHIHMQSLNRRRALVDTTENRRAIEKLRLSVGEVLEEKRYMDNYVKYLKGDLQLKEDEPEEDEEQVIDTKEEAMNAFLMGIFSNNPTKTPVASSVEPRTLGHYAEPGNGM